MKKSFIVMFVLGVLLLTSFTTPDSTPSATPLPAETSALALATSAKDVIGFWQLGSGPRALFFEFDEDGTYRMVLGDVNNLEDSPQHQGQYKFADGLLTFITSDESAVCAGQSGTYEVHLLEEGRLGLSLREDQCSFRGATNFSSMEPLSP